MNEDPVDEIAVEDRFMDELFGEAVEPFALDRAGIFFHPIRLC